jgi:perosamine synthetase
VTDPRLFGDQDTYRVSEVIASQVLWRGNGPLWSPLADNGVQAVDSFEDAFAEWTGAPFAHAVNSGTSANEAAIWSLGLDAGGEVLCPSASPVFVPMAILATGGIPVFVDVDPETMLVNPDKLSAAMSDKTRAIVALHLWGRPAPMNEILDFAAANGLQVVEDCAQAPVSYLGGKRLGSFGDAACFSLQQSKLVTAGEGGVFTTADSSKYARAVLYSNTGIPSFRHGITLGSATSNGVQSFGHNHRMSELQGAVALAQLQNVAALIAGRRQTVELLSDAIADLQNPRVSVLDPIAHSDVSYWRLPVRVPDGTGDYIGIPQTEPIFVEMAKRRTTPFGYPLPRHVDYGPNSYRGAQAGARKTRVLPIDPFLDADRARSAVAERLRFA